MNNDKITIIRYFSKVIFSKKFRNYELNRLNTPKDISEVNITPELKQIYSDVDIEKIVSQTFGKELSEFTELITQQFSKDDLIIFYNNINALDIVIKNMTSNIAGGYNPENNTLIIDKDTPPEDTINHELFHMASSFYKDGIAYIGFSQMSKDPKFINIGVGINEGYTQYLTERYFKNTPKTYRELVRVARFLEKTVGQEKMESLYLNADLQGLINELRKYSNDEEIENFFFYTDLINKYTLFGIPTPKIVEELEKSFKNVFEYLLKIYIKKMKIQFNDGTITEKEFVDDISNYIFYIDRNVSNFECLNDETIKKVLNEALDMNLLDEKSVGKINGSI